MSVYAITQYELHKILQLARKGTWRVLVSAKQLFSYELRLVGRYGLAMKNLGLGALGIMNWRRGINCCWGATSLLVGPGPIGLLGKQNLQTNENIN